MEAIQPGYDQRRYDGPKIKKKRVASGKLLLGQTSKKEGAYEHRNDPSR
jgi:hypothetical protein